MKKILLFLLMFSLAGAVFSQQEKIEKYSLGDQMFYINAGLVLPIAIYQLDTGDTVPGFDHLSLGGSGALKWASFLNNEFALGFQLAGMFAFTPNGRTLSMVPVTAELSWFFRKYPFDIPLHLGLGITFNSLEENFKLNPIIKPGFSFYWNINPEWALGLNFIYWFIPEFYSNDTRDSLGNFFEISVSLLYHFS